MHKWQTTRGSRPVDSRQLFFRGQPLLLCIWKLNPNDPRDMYVHMYVAQGIACFSMETTLILGAGTPHTSFSTENQEGKLESGSSASLHRPPPPQRQSRKAKRGVICVRRPPKTYIRVQNGVPSCALLRSTLLRALTWFKLDMDTTAVLLEPPPPAIEPVKHKNPSAYGDTPGRQAEGWHAQHGYYVMKRRRLCLTAPPRRFQHQLLSY